MDMVQYDFFIIPIYTSGAAAVIILHFLFIIVTIILKNVFFQLYSIDRYES